MGQTRKQTKVSKMKKALKTWIKSNKLAIARTKDKTGEVVKQTAA
jgi:hypothetical protein